MASGPAATKTRFAVIGGGILGMTLALRLRQAGADVTLYEGASHLGGLADSWQLPVDNGPPITWDRHYHVTLLSDSHLRNLLRELGLDQEMKWVETKTGFYTDGKLVSMSNTLEFLRFPPLRLIDKLRLGATIFLTSRNTNWRKLEQITVVDYLTRMSGERTTEKIWLPLLRAKLGSNYQLTSAAFIWATINRLYAARRSGLKKEMFGYLSGGYARTLSQLTRALEAAGVVLRCRTKVERIESSERHTTSHSSFFVTSAEGNRDVYDRVALTIPSALIPNLCPELPPEEQKRHLGVRYQGIVCASVLLDRSLSPYYVTNITDGNVPFTGVIEMTALVSPAELQGKHLIYLPKYVPAEAEDFQVSDGIIRSEFLAGLKRLHPDLRDEQVLAFQVSRARYVMPIPTLGYSQSVPPRRSRLSGLYTVNGSQIVNGTLNVNETIKLAEESVSELMSHG